MSELFALFDPDEDVEITHRNLPHWQQAGKTYFITFRTDDSLPEPVIDALYTERNVWLRRHGIDPESGSWRNALLQQPPAARREYHRQFSEKFHRLLDECHGQCVLRDPALARIVGDSLLHFDGQRYQMGDFIVMPNHVHLIAQFSAFEDMKLQCKSWKHFTATEINRQLGRKGHFWQAESFDHLIRSAEQFEAIRRYIAQNPIKANLREGEYLQYVRN